ncbi:hypothetical protein Tco_0085940 [Tanacetum coccineum]
MDRDNKEEFIEATAKSRKRRHDDQDPPPPPPKDSDQSKKKRHDSDVSTSKQPQAQTLRGHRYCPSSKDQDQTRLVEACTRRRKTRITCGSTYNPLVSVEVLRYDIKRSKSENKGIVPTEMELVLEQTQQGTSHEVSVSIEGVEE